MSHGPDLGDASRPLAAQVDQILTGARPSDLPVQQPTKLERRFVGKAQVLPGKALTEPVGPAHTFPASTK
jgi:hypothetical protein